MKRSLLLFLLLITIEGVSQSVTELSDNLDGKIETVESLPDHGYSFQQIVSDTSLLFTRVQGSLPPAKAYWLRVKISNPYPATLLFNVRALPNLKNTFYYLNPVTGKWTSRQTGLLRPDRKRKVGAIDLDFKGNTKNTFYIKLDLHAIGEVKKTFKAKVIFTHRDAAALLERNIMIAWIAGLAVLLLFFLNNLYVYLSFKDKSVRYYLMAQMAGMVYLTSYWQLFRILIPCPVFSFGLHGDLQFYDLNHLLMHIAIVAILFSFVQLTRSYLDTERTIPGADRKLRLALFTYAVFSVIVALVNISGFYLEHYTLLIDNLFCLVLIALIVVTSVLGYIRKLPAATTFLMANILPLIFMTGIPLFHLFISDKGYENLWIPVLLIATQALGFSIAVVDRTKAIQNELQIKEIAHKQLEFNLREVEMKQLLTESENQKILASHEYQTSLNTLLQQRIEAQHRELVSSTLYMVQKNELLGNLKTEIDDMTKPARNSLSIDLKNISLLLEKNLHLDTDWNQFKIHFEQIHPHFFKTLKENHPTLTLKETRLYAYFHLNLSHKEIAALLNIDPASVRRAKTRLYKKMAISEKETD